MVGLLDSWLALEGRKKLQFVAAATLVAFALVAVLGDTSGGRSTLATTKLSDDISSTAAKDFFGEHAGEGWVGRDSFEPDPGADIGITSGIMEGSSVNEGYDYSNDLEHRMEIHRGEVVDADSEQAIKNLDTANKKLDMPGIISFP